MEHFGIVDGTVRDVPKLSAPGFISFYADGVFNDASNTISGGLALRVRSSTPDYAGFRAVFAAATTSPSYSCRHGGRVPFSNGCFKALFKVAPGDDYSEVTIPFNAFSDHWDDKIGDQTITCAEDETVCPTDEDLNAIKRIEIMAEGVGGNIHLELESIIAYSA